MRKKVTLNDGSISELDMERVYHRELEFENGVSYEALYYYGTEFRTRRGFVPVEEIRVGDIVEMKDKSFKKLVRIYWIS